MEIYLSPYRLIKNISRPILTSEKEKLVARLKKSGQTELIIENASYNIEDIQDAFESLENKDYFQYHRTIYSNKELLNFLENKEGDYFRLLSALKWSSMDEGLKEFILPFYSASYQLFLYNAILKADYTAVKKYAEFVTFLTPKYIDVSNSNINLLFDDFIDKLKSVRNSESINFEYKEIEILISKNLLMCFDCLPNYFQSVKVKYQEELIAFAKFLNSSGKNSIAKEIAGNLRNSGCKLDFSISDYELDKFQAQIKPPSVQTKKNRIFAIILPVTALVSILVFFALRTEKSKIVVPNVEQLVLDRQSNLVSVAGLSKSLRQYYKPYSEPDLVRYYYAQRYNDLIAETPENQIKKRNVKRSKPYRRLLGDDEFIDRDSSDHSNQKFVQLKNKSEFDAVIFFVRDGSKIAAHSYLYSGDTKVLKFLPQYEGDSKDYDIYAYVGKDWNDFYRIRVEAKGLNGMFEFQPKCYSGLMYTKIKVNCLNVGAKQVMNKVIEISGESESCPVYFSVRDTLVMAR